MALPPAVLHPPLVLSRKHKRPSSLFSAATTLGGGVRARILLSGEDFLCEKRRCLQDTKEGTQWEGGIRQGKRCEKVKVKQGNCLYHKDL